LEFSEDGLVTSCHRDKAEAKTDAVLDVFVVSRGSEAILEEFNSVV